jgi:hypothetical protein
VESIDWSQPWFGIWRTRGQRVIRRTSSGLPVFAALNEEHDPPIRFVASVGQPAKAPYELYVAQSGCCPTRNNLHDFFNGLCWLQFPLAKTQLNRVQVLEIASAGAATNRGPVRDAITVFDENGALLDAPPALWEALLDRDWRRLFIELRPLWAQARVLVFGHALLEKLVQPRKEITAHVWRSPCPGGSIADIDAWLAGRLSAEQLAAKPFVPLPLMGIPGWCAGNQNFSFYDDSLVFRQPAGKKS